MAITDQAGWEECVAVNKDPYGKCCVDVARKVMEILDVEPGPFDASKLVSRADDELQAGGITGFMAGCVANMVSKVHSRGEEFRRSWNKEAAIGDEGERANNKPGAVLNPAILTIGKAGD